MSRFAIVGIEPSRRSCHPASWSLVLLGVAAGWIARSRTQRNQFRQIDLDNAVAAQRARAARELHDGFAQELAHIKLSAQRKQAVPLLIDLADRALKESRWVIAGLRELTQKPFERAFHDTLAAVARRADLRLVCVVETDLNLSEDYQEALLKIAREAALNAAQHSNGRRLLIVLRSNNGIDLKIVDDGDGKVDKDPDLSRFGLLTVQERARNLGGAAFVHSATGIGTCIEVRLP